MCNSVAEESVDSIRVVASSMKMLPATIRTFQKLPLPNVVSFRLDKPDFNEGVSILIHIHTFLLS
jgi:hypothetical protein